jgi:hypothetical protein
MDFSRHTDEELVSTLLFAAIGTDHPADAALYREAAKRIQESSEDAPPFAYYRDFSYDGGHPQREYNSINEVSGGGSGSPLFTRQVRQFIAGRIISSSLHGWYFQPDVNWETLGEGTLLYSKNV